MTEPETNDGYQELPPVDKGKGAWLFVVGAFILEYVYMTERKAGGESAVLTL